MVEKFYTILKIKWFASPVPGQDNKADMQDSSSHNLNTKSFLSIKEKHDEPAAR